jgi:hypothetical protein
MSFFLKGQESEMSPVWELVPVGGWEGIRKWWRKENMVEVFMHENVIMYNMLINKKVKK